MKRAPPGLTVAAAAAVASVMAGAGCTVGSGAGSARGSLYVLGCRLDSSDYRSDAFDLHPTFFAGEPIEDISPGVHANRLLIRMQSSGNGIEYNDTLYFDVLNTYEVARCIRGRTVNGLPDWDTRQVATLDSGTTGQVWCDWATPTDSDGGLPPAGDAGAADGGAAGGPVVMTAARARMHFGPLEYVQAHLAPLFTCNTARLVASAVDGWIDFQDFGPVEQPNLAAEMRGAIQGDFKVDFGQRLRATFHLVLQDDRVTTAIQDRTFVPAPRIGGTLDGFFDFDLDRGRAAQPFP